MGSMESMGISNIISALTQSIFSDLPHQTSQNVSCWDVCRKIKSCQKRLVNRKNIIWSSKRAVIPCPIVPPSGSAPALANRNRTQPSLYQWVVKSSLWMFTLSRMQTDSKRTWVLGKYEHDCEWKDVSSVDIEYTSCTERSCVEWCKLSWWESRGSKELLSQSYVTLRWSLVLYNGSKQEMGSLRCTALQWAWG